MYNLLTNQVSLSDWLKPEGHPIAALTIISLLVGLVCFIVHGILNQLAIMNFVLLFMHTLGAQEAFLGHFGYE